MANALALLSRTGMSAPADPQPTGAPTHADIGRASIRLISRGHALPFTAHATSPTITMPRVKAITTGSIPSFLDVILNFAESDTTSSLATQDTWLAQIKARGDKLVMYGDDTWLKLFPDFFARADGTSSFFVSVSGHLALRRQSTPTAPGAVTTDITLVNAYNGSRTGSRGGPVVGAFRSYVDVSMLSQCPSGASAGLHRG